MIWMRTEESKEVRSIIITIQNKCLYKEYDNK
jgi:hypothetical protein